MYYWANAYIIQWHVNISYIFLLLLVLLLLLLLMTEIGWSVSVKIIFSITQCQLCIHNYASIKLTNKSSKVIADLHPSLAIFKKVKILVWFQMMNEWMNEWMMHLYSALLCIAVHTKHFTIMWGGLSSTTTSDHRKTMIWSSSLPNNWTKSVYLKFCEWTQTNR